MQIIYEGFKFGKSLKFNNKQTVMLRRKNNDILYNQHHANQSPYRFQRKNPNLSPGLSPMRCRTPTRGNVSPFRTTTVNDNYRGQSPIKFVSNKVSNTSYNGFFRQEFTTSNISTNNHKYTTNNFYNDHSTRRQSYYENENSSKIKGTHQNAEKNLHHENTKLFSKLVSKLNSEKKKQPELCRRNTKPEFYKPTQISEYDYKSTGKQRHKTAQETLKIDPIAQNIKPVESVVYEQKSTRTVSQKKINVTVQKGKQNKIAYQQQTYKLRQHTNKTPMKDIENKSIKKSNNQNTSEMKYHSSNGNQQKLMKNYQESNHKNLESNKKNLESNKKDRLGYEEKYTSDLTSFIIPQKKTIPEKKPIEEFDDVKMYLDKIKDSYKFVVNKDDSIGNLSDAYKNVNVSLMNMDPFI